MITDFTEILPESMLDGNYSSRLRKNRGTIRFGYVEDPDDPEYMFAVPKEVETLIQGLRFLKLGHSLRRVAAWISGHAGGRRIDHTSLHALLKTEQEIQRQRRALAMAVGLPEDAE
jgi:hypothetical protein